MFGSVLALWLESPVLAGMMADSVLLPELLWNIGFFARLLFGVNVAGVGGYMFDPHRPLYLRGLSLFHVALPLLLLFTVKRLGYRRRSLPLQIILGSAVLLLTYAFTPIADNINWVFSVGGRLERRVSPLVYFGSLLVMVPVLVYLPAHVLLGRLYGRHAGDPTNPTT